MHCGVVDTVGRIKKIIYEEYLRTPQVKHLRLRLARSGSLIPDETPLCDILARTTAAWNVDFILESSDPARLPIQIQKSTGFTSADFEDGLIEDDSLDTQDEKYPIYQPETGILTVKFSEGSQFSQMIWWHDDQLFYAQAKYRKSSE